VRQYLIAAAFALPLLAAGAASAETVRLGGTLGPPAGVASSGKGTVSATYDTVDKQFTYEATYSGLTGPATAAHFHGPAGPGQNAPPVVPIANPASPISGSATLTDAQAADLLAGRWYLNVHSAANRGGEIRAQVTKQ